MVARPFLVQKHGLKMSCKKGLTFAGKIAYHSTRVVSCCDALQSGSGAGLQLRSV